MSAGAAFYCVCWSCTRGFSVRLLEQTLRAAPNQAMGARQIRFYRVACWAPVGDALRGY